MMTTTTKDDCKPPVCPFPYTTRTGLPERPERIRKLPVDERGYPVPFFVAWIDGKPDFRVVRPGVVGECVKFDLCWVCGQKLGGFKVFPIGPMCAINRVSSEPPSHRDCATFSVMACPFMIKPHMKRREDEMTQSLDINTSGVMIKRNPGCAALWITRYYKLFDDGMGGRLFRLGEPVEVEWWAEGRKAKREEILASIESGYPILQNACRSDKERKQLEAEMRMAMKLLPA